MKLVFRTTVMFCLAILIACQQEEIDTTTTIEYPDSIYSLKEYKAERHPPICRNGLGIDIYHEGNASLDTMYLSYEKLPPYHPNNPGDSGAVINRYNEETGDSVTMEYDLLFYNEFAYTLLSTGDYSSTGYPVIFMYTNPTDDSKSTKACMVGQGIDCFDAFTYDSIAQFKDSLKSDPLIDLAAYRTEVHTATINGTILTRDFAEILYTGLVIGHKFRPNIGGIFNMPDVSDESQIDLQPVFLIKTREGLYAKFMVTRFKGAGVDTQKMTLQWQALR
ncbi:MAG: hypothetical protein PHH37_08905 [Paludibacter sp.]|nr:hypothetical protein [Paludibacter sp.]